MSTIVREIVLSARNTGCGALPAHARFVRPAFYTIALSVDLVGVQIGTARKALLGPSLIMNFLVYVSSAVEPFSPAALVDLLSKSKEKNARLGVSGMLLYKDGNFMQVLEGEQEPIRRLYAQIALDPRHKGLLLLSEGTLETRQFPGWSMGFRDLNAADVRPLPGYSQFLNTPLTGAEFSSDPTRCQKLLTTFKRSM